MIKRIAAALSALALLACAAAASAQDSVISSLTSAGSLTGAEVAPVDQGTCPGTPPTCTTVKVPLSAIKTFVLSGLSFSSLSGAVTAAQLPNPGPSALGGIESITSASHQWVAYIDTSGVPHQSQPAAADISGLAASATTDTTNPANLHSGIIREPDADGVSLVATGDIATIPVPVARYAVGASRILNCTGSPGSAVIQIWTGAGGTGAQVAGFTSFSGATSAIVTGTNTASAPSSAATLYVRVTATGTGACDVNLQVIDLP